MEARKVAEGKAELASAAKCSKASFWSRPDFDGAAYHYEKAAVAFKIGRDHAAAIDAYAKAAQVHQKLDAGSFMAAKHLESAALIAARDAKQPAAAAAHYVHASDLHATDGALDLSAAALLKAAKALDDSDVPHGVALMVRACDVLDGEEEESRLRLSVDTFKTAVNFLVRHKHYAEAAQLLERQVRLHAKIDQPHGVARCELSRILALLSADSYEDARSCYDAAMGRGDGFAGSEEGDLALQLLDAFATQDEEAVKECSRSSYLVSLENQLALLARSLTLSGVRVPATMRIAKSAKGGAPPPPPPPPPPPEGATGDFGELAPEDDLAVEEEDDDLC